MKGRCYFYMCLCVCIYVYVYCMYVGGAYVGSF